MVDSRTRIVAPIRCWLAAGCCLLAGSCSQSDPIHSYTIDPIRQAEPLTYDIPAEWTESVPGMFQFALFTSGEGDDAAEVSISNAGGTLDLNVNRWRNQIGLPPVSMAEMNESLEETEVGGKPAVRIQIDGSEKSIRGVIVPGGEGNWFFKLTGPAELVGQETERFDAFVESVQFAE